MTSFTSFTYGVFGRAFGANGQTPRLSLASLSVTQYSVLVDRRSTDD